MKNGILYGVGVGPGDKELITLKAVRVLKEADIIAVPVTKGGAMTAYEIVEDYVNPGEELHLAWVENEEDIPPRLLRYIKENYSVKTGYSKTIGGKCFANHCDYCGALQGNWFLFNEPDSPLSSCVDGDKLAEKMSRVKIKGIPIEDDLQLDWNIGFCSNDYAYLKYGQLEELVLSTDPENEYVTYEELYSRR